MSIRESRFPWGWGLVFALTLVGCGGGGSDPPDPWTEFSNTQWEGFPLAERQLPPIPGPLVPEVVKPGDTAFFPLGMLSPLYNPPRMVELGFIHAVPMINAVTAYSRDRGFTATVEIRAIRLVCENITSHVKTIRADVHIGRGQAERQTGQLKWDTYNRGPGWFTSGIATTKVRPTYTDFALVANLRDNPGGIYHAWLDPRVAVKAGEHCDVEVDVRITGDARLQVGLDQWRGPWLDYNHYSDGCVTSNNCQAYLGRWHGDTGGFFQTIRAPFG